MSGSILKSAFKAIVNGREKASRHYVTRSLLALDDKTLASFGKSRELIEKGEF